MNAVGKHPTSRALRLATNFPGACWLTPRYPVLLASLLVLSFLFSRLAQQVLREVAVPSPDRDVAGRPAPI